MSNLKFYKFGLVLALSVILGLLLFLGHTSATGSAKIYLSPTSGTYNPGNQVKVTIHEDSGSTAANDVQVNLDYPLNLLEYISVTNSASWSLAAQTSAGSGSIQLNRGALPSVTGDKVVATVTFKVKAVGQAGLSLVSGSTVYADDGSGTALTTSYGDSSYTLVNPTPAPKPNPKPAPVASSSKKTPPKSTATPASPSSSPPEKVEPKVKPVTTSRPLLTVNHSSTIPTYQYVSKKQRTINWQRLAIVIVALILIIFLIFRIAKFYQAKRLLTAARPNTGNIMNTTVLDQTPPQTMPVPLSSPSRLSHHMSWVFILAFAAIGSVALFHSFAYYNPHIKYGDLNNDNIVNGADLSILLAHFGGSNVSDDINSDGTINGTDLSILLSYFGENVPPPSQQTTEVGFDASFLTCKGKSKPISTTYSVGEPALHITYPECRDEYNQQLAYLAQNNVKVVRLMGDASQFFATPLTNSTYSNLTYGDLNQSYVANFDDQLNLLKQNKMKAIVTLNLANTCSTPAQSLYFNWRVLTDQALRQKYLNGLSAFLSHFKDNPTIQSYDLLNESDNQFFYAATKSSFWKTKCGLPTTPTVADLTALVKQLYTTAKTADSIHPFTFSFGRSVADHVRAGQLPINDLKPYIDYYDVHAYTALPTSPVASGSAGVFHSPADWYNDFNSLNLTDKPMIQGEVGVHYSGDLDPNGNRCEIYINDAILKPMSDWCQQQFLANAQQFISQANAHGVKQIYFHGGAVWNRLFYANYTSQSISSFSASLAAQYIYDYDASYYGRVAP